MKYYYNNILFLTILSLASVGFGQIFSDNFDDGEWSDVWTLNDTSSYHSGCKKVIEYIKADIHNCGYKLIDSFGSNVKNIQEAHTFIDKVDLVILNGEGSMHHNHRETPTKLLEVLGNAKGQGKKTALINTVWQEMKLDDRTIEVLKDSYVSCREIKSAQEFYKNKIDADIYLDLSYFCDVLPLEYDFSDIVVGRFFGTEYKREDAKVIEDEYRKLKKID